MLESLTVAFAYCGTLTGPELSMPMLPAYIPLNLRDVLPNVLVLLAEGNEELENTIEPVPSGDKTRLPLVFVVLTVFPDIVTLVPTGPAVYISVKLSYRQWGQLC